MAFILDGTTGIATVDGSVSAPSQRGQDTNSGISYAADTIKFSTNGVERLAISNSGLSGDGSGLSGISAGITMADQWRLTTSFSGASGPITTNWERADTDYDKIGTGMTESSGIFSFPTTGIYYIHHNVGFYWTSSIVLGSSRMAVSTDGGSNFSMRSYGYTTVYNNQDTMYSSSSGNFMLDVTNTSNVKVQLSAVKSSSSIGVIGSTSANHTTIIFLRLGDT